MMTKKNIPLLADEIKKAAIRVGLLAVLCALPLNPARASFSKVECGDFYGNVMVSGYTNIAGNKFSNNSSISVTLNNLSNTNGDKNVAAAVLEHEPNVGYGVGVVRVNNGAGGTMQAITSDSGSWAAGFWADQIYGDPAIAELIVNNYGTMNGQATNSIGSAFGFHNYNLYGGLNMTNQSGATCSGAAKGGATGIDALCYYGPINFVNNGTATSTSSGVNGADVWPLGLNLFTYDSTNRAPIYCENNGYISASATGGQTNHVFGARVWAQGGSMVLINRGTFKGSSWGGSLCQANGVYCGSNVGDDWVVNTGQMIGEGGPGWALGIENDGDNNGSSPYIATINVLNSGVISNGVTSGQSSEGIYGGMGIVLWVSPGPTYLTNTASGKIHGGNMGIWAGVYGGPITIYNSGEIYGGGGEAFHLGDGNDTVYLTGSPTVTGVMNGGPGNNSLIFNIDGTLQYVNGHAANNGTNLSNYGLGTSGNIVVSGKNYSWQNFNVSGTTTTVAPPPPPGLTATSASASQINLAWGALTNAASYNVKRSLTNGGPYLTIASGVTATNYVDSGLVGGTIYFYVVSAVVFGNETPDSDQAAAAPVLSNYGSLIHRYSFLETGGTNTADSVGGPVWNGTLPNGGTFSGGRLQLSASGSQFVQLPAGILSNYTAVTIELWAGFPGTLPANCSLFGFGNINGSSGNGYIFCQPRDGRIAITASDWSGEQKTSPNPSGNWSGLTSLHVTAVFNPPQGRLALYTNGVLAAQNTAVTIPLSSVNELFCFIGRSLYSADAYFNFNLDEFRIYNRALSTNEIAATDALGSSQLLSADRPRMNLTLSGANRTLSWPLANAGYTLQSRTNLVMGNWMNVTSPVAQIVGGNWQVTLPPANAGSIFYRLMK
jgi:hypothetical protein